MQHLGVDDSPGFGWHDIDVWKPGVVFRANPTLTLRAGYSGNDQPTPGEEIFFNILAPGVIEQHAFVGATWQLDDNNRPDLRLHPRLRRNRGRQAVDPAGHATGLWRRRTGYLPEGRYFWFQLEPEALFDGEEIGLARSARTPIFTSAQTPD